MRDENCEGRHVGDSKEKMGIIKISEGQNPMVFEGRLNILLFVCWSKVYSLITFYVR